MNHPGTNPPPPIAIPLRIPLTPEVARDAALMEWDNLQAKTVQQALAKEPPVLQWESVKGGRVAQNYSGTLFGESDHKLQTWRTETPTTAQMMQHLQKEGARRIQVSGHPQFQKDVWMMGNTLGMEVEGFQPSRADERQLRAAKLMTRDAREPTQPVNQPRKTQQRMR